MRELDRVVLTVPLPVPGARASLPEGAVGTVVGVWEGERAYEVEFSEPRHCLLTVAHEHLAPHEDSPAPRR